MVRDKNYNKSKNKNLYLILDFLRAISGAFLIYKGVSFMINPDYYDFFANQINKIGGIYIIHLVVSFNIVGGTMILLGFFTRWVIFIQIPILLGAIATNYIGQLEYQNLYVSLLILLVFIFFLFFGSGKYTLDRYFKIEI